MLSSSVCIQFPDDIAGDTSPPGKTIMQYSSMASKSTVPETSSSSAGFESSAGLETNSSYSCRTCVYRVR